MDITNAIQFALDGNAVLFLGSGFSIGGINNGGTNMKIGKDLSHVICEDLGIAESDDLTITSDRYLNDVSCKKSLTELINLLKRECACSDVSETQSAIVALPWHRIYTTNYDNIVEICSKKEGIRRESITITNRRYKPGCVLEQAIIHINGFIETVDENNFFDEFRITDETYAKNGLLESDWRNLFENDLTNSKVVVFIGYSLQYDQDIVRFITNLNIKNKCVFIDIDTITNDSAYRLEQHGTLFKIGAVGFAEKVKEVKANYIPHSRLIEIKGFEERTEQDYISDKSFSSNDVFNLLAKGILNRNFLKKPNYCVRRTLAINEIKQQVKKHKIIIIQSYLGNGKTIFLESLAMSLIDEYRVFFLNSIDNFHEDMNIILSTNDKEKILIIDDGDRYRLLFKEFGRNFPVGIHVIMSCRTAINIHWYHSLIENYNFSEKDIYVKDIDKLEGIDVEDLRKVLDYSHLWGNYDRYTSNQKKKLIVDKYKESLSNVFYLLLDSEIISKEVAKVIKTLETKKRLREFVLAQTINLLCQLKFSYMDICKFINVTGNDFTNYSHDDSVKEIIDYQNSEFQLRSPVFLQYIVRNTEFDDDVLNMMVKLFEKCSYNDEMIKRYESQRRSMVSRSDIRMVFSVKDNSDNSNEHRIFNYYDRIKELPTAKENPFFWLQFAITTLNLGNYELAKVYFDNAYANAEKIQDFNSYQIDTHYARLLLTQELKINRNNIKHALENFNKAHELLFKNSSAGKMDYSLRQTGIYLEYYNTYCTQMSDDEKQEFLRVAVQFIDRFKDYFSKNNTLEKIGRYVKQAYSNYRKIFNNTLYELKCKECDAIFRNFIN